MVDDADAVRADHQEREAIRVLDAVSHQYTVHSGLRGVSYRLPHWGLPQRARIAISAGLVIFCVSSAFTLTTTMVALGDFDKYK